MPATPPGDSNLLPPYRVLDLTGPEGVFCGKFLADYGADVVKIEPPGGEAGRFKPPFVGEQESGEGSGYFLFYNTNKKSVTLNINHDSGQQIFKQMILNADVVLESFPVGYMASLGLDYDSLKDLNPNLIMVSLTPFGQTGSWKDYKATDLTLMAASGFMQITGEPDGPPVRQGNEQSHFPGAQYAATSILAALYHRDILGGQGQYIDISLQEALITYYTDAHPALAWQFLGENVTRVGTNSTLVIPLGAYPSEDGWIALGIITPREWEALSNWIYEVTGDSEVLSEVYKGGNQDRAPYIDIITAMVVDFTCRFSSDYLFHEGQKRNLVFIPVNNVEDLLEDPQLAASNFWYSVDHPQTGSIKYPLGVFDSDEVTPQTNPAPELGAHNLNIYMDEMKFTQEELKTLKDNGVI